MSLDAQLDRAARRFSAISYRDGLGERVDIQQQSGTAGAGSATPAWTAVEENWPCFAKPIKEAQGARGTPEMVNAPSYSYELQGPAVKVVGATVTPIALSKEMRIVIKARGAQPQRILTVVDFAILSGVELKILATLNS